MKTLASFVTKTLKQQFPHITEEVVKRTIESAKKEFPDIDWNNPNQIVMVSNLLNMMEFTINAAEVIMTSKIHDNDN